MEHPPITLRRPHIAFGPVPKGHWYSGGPATEDFLNAISYWFPAGERFFMQAVRRYQDRIDDAVLREQVRAFIFQEAAHTREHTRCNLVLDRTHGYGRVIAAMGAVILGVAERLPGSWQLACTAALEHFTAMLSDDVLRGQEHFLARSDPAFASLWLWHAVEETEHKAVAFDVYRRVFGNGFWRHAERVAAMAVCTLFFCLAAILGTAILSLRRRKGPAPARHGAMHFIGQSIPWRLYRAYYRRGFHPWQHDNSALVAEWKNRFGDFGAMPGDAG